MDIGVTLYLDDKVTCESDIGKYNVVFFNRLSRVESSTMMKTQQRLDKLMPYKLYKYVYIK